MSFSNSILGRWWHRRRAMALYRHAMDHAKNKDHRAALEEYTAAIEMVSAPADVRAMALYNRAVVYSTIHNEAQAICDLHRLLDTAGAAANVRLEAKRKLVRMERASGRSEHDESRPDWP